MASVRQAADELDVGPSSRSRRARTVRLVRAQALVELDALERFRLHAIAVQRAVDRIARGISHPNQDEPLVAALLHDVGKRVLFQAYSGYSDELHAEARTPEARLPASGATSASTTRSSAGCLRGAGASRSGSPR